MERLFGLSAAPIKVSRSIGCNERIVGEPIGESQFREYVLSEEQPENAAGIPLRHIKPQYAMIKINRPLQVRHLQMNVADARPRGLDLKWICT